MKGQGEKPQDFVTKKSEMSKSKGPKGSHGRSKGDSHTKKNSEKCFKCTKQGHSKKH